MQTKSVFSHTRDVTPARICLPADMAWNTRIRAEGLSFLQALPPAIFPAAFLDPQYRGVLDHLAYGNEGQNRGQARASLAQMSDTTIAAFIQALARILSPSGHLFLWVDKFHLCTGMTDWLSGTRLEIVDLITWHKQRMGMGYRTRRTAEYLVVLQQAPRRAKGVWCVHDIPDVWTEKVPRRSGIHPKPVQLQARLIEAVTHPGDAIVDPAAGTFSVLEACRTVNRNFLGCDLNG